MGCIAQIRFRLFTGNYSQYTFQCITPHAADAAPALKRTLTNLSLTTVPEAYSLFPAEQSHLHSALRFLGSLQSQNRGRLLFMDSHLFIMSMSLFQCAACMSHYSTADTTEQINTSASIIAVATIEEVQQKWQQRRASLVCYDLFSSAYRMLIKETGLVISLLGPRETRCPSLIDACGD